MKPGATDTLFYPIAEALIDAPECALFLNAQLPVSTQIANAAWFRSTVMVQGDRVGWLDVKQAGFEALPDVSDIEEDRFDTAFVRAGKHRRENETLIAAAQSRVTDDGMIFVAGAKTDGIASLKKRLANLGCAVEVWSKHHGQVLMVQPNAALASLDHPPQHIEGGFETAPGMFSADHPDKGSVFLAQHLPNLSGKRVADFGAGWGYLSASIAQQGQPRALDMFEAHWQSLQAAKRAMARLHPELAVDIHWIDLTREPVERRYDAIIMNPPFHAGRDTRRSLGEAFVQRASNALVPGGSLWIVANTSLTYEPVLDQTFTRHEEIVRADGFKIIHARR